MGNPVNIELLGDYWEPKYKAAGYARAILAGTVSSYPGKDRATSVAEAEETVDAFKKLVAADLVNQGEEGRRAAYAYHNQRRLADGANGVQLVDNLIAARGALLSVNIFLHTAPDECAIYAANIAKLTQQLADAKAQQKEFNDLVAAEKARKGKLETAYKAALKGYEIDTREADMDFVD